MFAVTRSVHMPLMYELDVRDDGRTLVITMPRKVWEQMAPALMNQELLRFIQQSIGIPSFIPPGILPWGFGPILLSEENRDPGWVTILCELPQFFSSQPSLESEANVWMRARAVSASLHWLFYCMQSLKDIQDSSPKKSQLLEVQVDIRKDDGRYTPCLNAGFSIAACAWIESQVRGVNYERHSIITGHMINAYHRIYGMSELDGLTRHELRAEIRSPCSIHFSTRGDRTGLGSFTNHKEAHGLELYCHNLDTSMQQLVLLVGVASFHSLARKAGY